MVDSANLMNEGLSLMVFGMGFVFVFLALLILATSQMSRLVQKLWPENTEKSSQIKGPSQPQSGVNDEVIAAISTAIHLHQSRKK